MVQADTLEGARRGPWLASRDTRRAEPYARRLCCGLAVLAIHIPLFLALQHLKTSRRFDVVDQSPPISVELFSEPSPTLAPPAPVLQSPAEPFVAEPTFEIARSSAASIAKSDVEGTLPARVDPKSPNLQPALPDSLRATIDASRTVVVVVRSLVLPDGSVGGTELAGSSGDVALDALALSYVRSNWRFLPAVRGGTLSSDWITVEVLFQHS